MTVWSVPRSQTTAGLVTHETQSMDTRARWMMQMIQHWGAMTFLGDAMHDAAGSTKKLPSKQEIVMIAAELVQAAWDEATNRGWIIDVEDFRDAQDYPPLPSGLR